MPIAKNVRELLRRERIATDKETVIMQMAQEFVNEGDEEAALELAEEIWEGFGFYDIEGFDTENSNFIDLVLSQPVIWIAEDDENTCEYCEELRGKDMAMSDLPEQHENCRCGLSLVREGLLDVTEIVLKELREFCQEAIDRPFDVSWLISQVNVNKPWDIKTSHDVDADDAEENTTPWEYTLKIPYPGAYDTPIVFDKRIVTPEWLGNFTYGYIAAATKMGGIIAKSGSIMVALFGFLSNTKISGDNILELLADFMAQAAEAAENEISDHPAIEEGDKFFREDVKNGLYDRWLVGVLDDFTSWLIENELA